VHDRISCGVSLNDMLADDRAALRWRAKGEAGEAARRY
jgi:hypothetical protein